MAEDAALLLQDVVGSLDNLPSEVMFLLQEIGHKEGKVNDYKNRAVARDQSIQRHCRPQLQGGQGLLVSNPKEDQLINKIRIDLNRAQQQQEDKVALTERGCTLLHRHLNRIQSQLELLTPNVPPLPTLPAFTPTTTTTTTTTHTTHSQQQQANNAYNPTAHSGQFVNPYSHNYQQQYGLTQIDKRKLAAGSPTGGIPLLPAAGPNALPYSPNGQPIAPSPNGNRQVRPSRMSYPGGPPLGVGVGLGVGGSLGGGGPGGGGGTPIQQAQQLQQHQLAQHQHLQQQQLRLQQQAQALQQQQMANHHQMQQLHHLQQHGHAGGGGAQHGGQGQGQGQKKRSRQEEDHLLLSSMEVDSSAGGGDEGTEEDMTPYCFCHRPSFGEMIGCDAPDCAIEWFHLACVGLKTVPPEGASWYCRDCKAKQEQKSQGGRRRK